MAGGGIEVARAQVTIIPKSDGTSDKVIREIVDPFSESGNDAGAKAGNAFASKFSSFAGKAAKTMGIGLAAGFGVASAAVGAFAKSSVEAGKQFDASMAQVAATMGKSVDEISGLRDFAQEMGAKTAFSASEAADALNYMALAGYDAQTSMKMLPNVLNLAAAGGIDLAYASDMVTDTQSALGLTLEQTTELVDKMAATASKSNTSVAQLGEALLTVGGTAKTMSGGTTEAAQALGILADNGIKGSEGGTALRNVLLGLSSAKFEKTFGKLGVSAYDAEGNMRSLKDVLGDMNSAMENMTVEERTEALSGAFNKIDLKSLNALLGTSADRWDELAAAIDGSAGAAERMAATQLDNLEGDITIFKSALEGAQIALSDSLTPALREFVRFGTDGLGRVTEMIGSPEFSSFAQGFASSVTSGLASAAGAVSDFLLGTAAEFDEFGTQISGGSAGLIDSFLGSIDAEGFARAFQGIADAIGSAFGEGGKAATAKDFGTAFANALNAAVPVMEAATPIIGAAAQAVSFLADNAGAALPVIAGIAVAFAAIEAGSAVAGVVSAIGGALSAIGIGGGAAAAGLTATAGGETAAGAAAAGSAAQLLAVGAAVLMIGGGVALAAAGMWVLADAAIRLSDSGGDSAAIMAGMAVGIVALGAGAAAAGAALTAGALGLVAFGAAVLMAGAGIGIASAGISLLAGQLPAIAQYGMQAGSAIAAMGAGLLAMGAGSVSAGAGLLVLGSGLAVASAALVVATPAMAAASGGAALLGGALSIMAGAVLDVGRGAADMGWGLSAAADSMPRIASGALSAGSGIGILAAAMSRVSSDLETGSAAMARAGDGAQAMSAGVSAAASRVLLAAAAFSAMGSAGGSSIAGISRSAAEAGLAMSAFASLADASMRKAASSVRSAAAQIKRSLDIPDKTIRINVAAGSVKLPHFAMTGEFDARTGSVPKVDVSWWKTGAVFTRPAVVGVGEGREPEGVFPLSWLERQMERMDAPRGGDTYIIEGIEFREGTPEADAIKTLVRGVRREARARG